MLAAEALNKAAEAAGMKYAVLDEKSFLWGALAALLSQEQPEPQTHLSCKHRDKDKKRQERRHRKDKKRSKKETREEDKGREG